MNSCLYECSVMHHRLAPKEHRFRYRIFMLAIDLDEIDSLAARIPFFSRNRPNLYTFRDRDHLTVPGFEKAGVKENITAFLAEHRIQVPPGGRIMLVTLPRVLGYVFNPVSFYFCFDNSGSPLCAVVEVGNTFGEMKPYVLPELGELGRFRLITPKHFYVSPFSELDLAFDFNLRIPDATLSIRIDDRAGDRRVLLSTLTGLRSPFTVTRLAWLTLKYPLITLKVIALIHWQALLLWLKRLPWRRKSANPELQRDVLHPHTSLTQNTP